MIYLGEIVYGFVKAMVPYITNILLPSQVFGGDLLLLFEIKGINFSITPLFWYHPFIYGMNFNAMGSTVLGSWLASQQEHFYCTYLQYHINSDFGEATVTYICTEAPYIYKSA